MGKPHYYQKVINSQPPLIFVYGVDLSCYGDFRRLQRYKAYRFSIKAPPQTVVTRGFAATFLKFSVKPFWEPRKKRQFPNPANPCGSSHCGLL